MVHLHPNDRHRTNVFVVTIEIKHLKHSYKPTTPRLTLTLVTRRMPASPHHCVLIIIGGPPTCGPLPYIPLALLQSYHTIVLPWQGPGDKLLYLYIHTHYWMSGKLRYPFPYLREHSTHRSATMQHDVESHHNTNTTRGPNILSSSNPRQSCYKFRCTLVMKFGGRGGEWSYTIWM